MRMKIKTSVGVTESNCRMRTRGNVVVIEPSVGSGCGLHHDGETAEDGQRTAHVRMKKIIELNVSRAVFHDILHYNLQPDSAAVAGRGALLPRLDSRQGAEDVRTRAGSRKGEMLIESC